MTEFDYQPYFCEENVWRICERSPHETGRLYAVFISNRLGATPLWGQRAAPSPTEPIFWDYHAIAVSRDDSKSCVWDLDSRLDIPVDFETWWRETFPSLEALDPPFHPRFRVVTAATFLASFSSDRSHMQRADGSWRRPPPEWPPIYDVDRGMILEKFTDMTDETFGTVLGAAEFRDAFLQ